MYKIMIFLTDVLGVSRDTNEKLKSLVEKMLLILLTIICLVDWDKTLDTWGF